MFGESESESPRVPSPWDSLISNPPSPPPIPRSQITPSSLSTEIIPSLVPEADDGNVEYKLQLLSPSPARFARLVTQLKWRLLEGGGQAYYEIGVADSGALVGLPRAELEQSLETLEMMAGEIGASVIVVKEIEVPAVMAGLAAAQTDLWNGKRNQRKELVEGLGDEGDSSTSMTETETEQSTDLEDEDNDMSRTMVLDKNTRTSSPNLVPLSSTGLESSPADNVNVRSDEDPHLSFSIDLEISTVFKPRPVRTRVHAHNHPLMGPSKPKRIKRPKYLPQSANTAKPLDEDNDTNVNNQCTKHNNRRHMRERKRAEKHQALLAYATGVPSISVPVPLDPSISKPSVAETDALILGLESLHVAIDDVAHVRVSPKSPTIPSSHFTPSLEEGEAEDNDDIFASETLATPFATRDSSASYLSATSAVSEVEGLGQKEPSGQSRLIVEALVVRKMSLDEAFLDFGGFALT